jgi:hypothetical protein
MNPRMRRIIKSGGKCIAYLLGLGLFIVVSHSLYEQHEASAMLRILSGVKFGITRRGDFESEMRQFPAYRSSTSGNLCVIGKCYTGDAFGIDNGFWGRPVLFPFTNLAMGIYFDDQGFAVGGVASLRREEIASATMEHIPMPDEGDQNLKAADGSTINLMLSSSETFRFSRFATACFTSITGCDTGERLLKK